MRKYKYRERKSTELVMSQYTVSPKGCWEWAKGIGSHGYGTLHRWGKPWKAHRVSWVHHRGEIPPGMQVLHRCDNRRCINPEHLFLGTNADNMRDRDAKGRGWDRRGPKNGSAKLTEEKVRLIRVLAQAQSQTAIAKTFGVSQPVISAILLKKIWQHVQ